MANDHYYAVIMAGGSGTRLWPLSRRENPKQMLKLVDDRSLFQIAVDRLEGLFDSKRIFVVTVREQAEVLKMHCPQIPEGNFLLEPMPRGTASVIGLAAIALKNVDSDAVMAVLTADHIIKNEAKFHVLLKTARDAAQDGYLVTLGIKPTFPATGYGYIEQGDLIDSIGSTDIFYVKKFVEKPTEDKAKKFCDSGGYAWNSGMFVWRVDRILDEFAHQMPNLFSKLSEIDLAWKREHRLEVIHRLWSDIRPETIDYGIMEKAEKVVVIPAEELGWNDVGSWNALFDILPSDENGNVVIGGMNTLLDTQDSLIYVGHDRRLLVTIGVKDLIVVDTGDVTLVCRKDQAQMVRKVVKQLMDESREDFI